METFDFKNITLNCDVCLRQEVLIQNGKIDLQLVIKFVTINYKKHFDPFFSTSEEKEYCSLYRNYFAFKT